MQVFIDTNVLLSFYHFTDDDLDSLNSVFVSHEQGAITVHLTEQVRDEFHRNRESKLLDALKRFGGFKPTSLQLPHFMRAYPQFPRLQELRKELAQHVDAIRKKAESDIRERRLAADDLIGRLFAQCAAVPTTDETCRRARMRVDRGNPPGKAGSLGDAINWLSLLENVPDGEDLFLITDDSDFYSRIRGDQISEFLSDEWRERKGSNVVTFKSLKTFLDAHYDGVTVSFDQQKRDLIEALETSGNFAATHAIVAELGKYRYYSLEEARAILDAVDANSQVAWIITDPDVMEFLQTAILPHQTRLDDPRHVEVVAAITEAESADEL